MNFLNTNMLGRITTYLRQGISRISKPSFKMNKQWRLIAQSKLEQYVHANNHIKKLLEVSKLKWGEMIGIA